MQNPLSGFSLTFFIVKKFISKMTGQAIQQNTNQYILAKQITIYFPKEKSPLNLPINLNFFSINPIFPVQSTHVCLVTQSCSSLYRPLSCSPPDSSVYGISRQENWMGCHFLLQGFFPTQELKLSLFCFLYYRPILYPQSHLYFKTILT